MMEFPGYNTLDPFANMNEQCPSLPPTYMLGPLIVKSITSPIFYVILILLLFFNFKACCTLLLS
ncbi:hypothetical protein Lalb_Chr16g0382531 [Lupinus albus]|uniref:Uncharacterized protein n=1 Tax=Lupinus albus TaxID=3870 RepID=A0A6A4P687_LUPAL|nr:hypothetical protein Lalb_Chr16g0382531 [Lupinus albus]